MRQDLVGEIYWRFCALLDVYDPERGIPLRPYLVHQLSIGIYTYARQQWRLRQREIVWDVIESKQRAQTFLDPTSAWMYSMEHKGMVSTLPIALEQLSVRQRQVVVWRYYEERSFEEIAQYLGVQVATARSLLRHGLNRLRKLVQPCNP